MAPARLRLITAAASLLLLAGLLASAYFEASRDRFPIGVLALAAFTLLAYALVSRLEQLLAVALAAAAVAYLLYLHAGHQTLPLATGLYAGGLFAAAELAHLSLAQGTIATPVARGLRAIGAEAALVAAVTVAALAVVLVARVPTGRTPWLEPVGFVAILAALLVLRGQLRSR
ncbi:MAG TPA: hypothetical protein VLW49_09775 [Gaiellaceae bacterium]|nr:hypothetical protein [Gaiellaceae bacterium]